MYVLSNIESDLFHMFVIKGSRDTKICHLIFDVVVVIIIVIAEIAVIIMAVVVFVIVIVLWFLLIFVTDEIEYVSPSLNYGYCKKQLGIIHIRPKNIYVFCRGSHGHEKHDESTTATNVMIKAKAIRFACICFRRRDNDNDIGNDENDNADDADEDDNNSYEYFRWL